MKTITVGGFMQEMSHQKAEQLIHIFQGLCTTKRKVLFLTQLPSDLKSKVFQKVEYSSYKNWQIGIIEVNVSGADDLIQRLWSWSFGTPLFFIITDTISSDVLAIAKNCVDDIRKNFRQRLISFFRGDAYSFYSSVFLKQFALVFEMGHDGETLEIHTIQKNPKFEEILNGLLG
ncbi:MAG: hypothetical protein WC421_09555 [Elusimicrobiales bacterium]